MFIIMNPKTNNSLILSTSSVCLQCKLYINYAFMQKGKQAEP